MVLEVFESARRPKCHITASLRHARRLPAHGLLSLPSLLRAFLLTGIKRNQAARICPYGPPKRPRVPLVHPQNGRFPAPGARLLALGDPVTTYEWIPHDRFFDSTKIPSRTALCTPKQQFSISLRLCPFCSSSLLLLLVSVSVSIRWAIGLSRLVGVASGGFSRGWRHVWFGHQNSATSIGAKIGSGDGMSCVWRLFGW